MKDDKFKVSKPKKAQDGDGIAMFVAAIMIAAIILSSPKGNEKKDVQLTNSSVQKQTIENPADTVAKVLKNFIYQKHM